MVMASRPPGAKARSVSASGRSETAEAIAAPAIAMASAMRKPEKPSFSAVRNSLKVKCEKRAPIVTPSTTLAGIRMLAGAVPAIAPESSSAAAASMGPSMRPAGTFSHSSA